MSSVKLNGTKLCLEKVEKSTWKLTVVKNTVTKKSKRLKATQNTAYPYKCKR